MHPNWRAPGVTARVAKMIDQKQSTRRRPAMEDDTVLDEARLRQQALGVTLRRIFDEIVNEPVPEEFLEILRQADERARGPGE
jgi:hypothetical protein